MAKKKPLTQQLSSEFNSLTNRLAGINKSVPLVVLFTVLIFVLSNFAKLSGETLLLIVTVLGLITKQLLVQPNEERNIILYILGLAVASFIYVRAVPGVSNLLYAFAQSFSSLMGATLFWICIIGLYNRLRR